MKLVKNVIVFDTEFISFKKGGQPIQIALTAYKFNQEKLEQVSNFSCYIKLAKHLYLNHYITEYTGIDDQKLKEEGITLEMAQNQVIEYLLEFPLKDTMLIGWDITNDIVMFNKLFNFNDDVIDISSFRWGDLSRTFSKIHSLQNSKKLIDACKYYDIKETGFHNAESDAKITAILLKKMIEVHGGETMLKYFHEVEVENKIKKAKKI